MNHFADVICVTTSDVFGFKKPTVDVHGGVDMKLAYPDCVEKIYDAVFVGRLHYTKGIKELIKIWQAVMAERPEAKLAIIGSGDSEEEDIMTWAALRPNNVKWFGYMGEERFDVYRQSKMVLYPTPYVYGHFSIGPVEAMACGCPMVAFNLDVMKIEKPVGAYLAEDIDEFYKRVLWLLKNDTVRYAFSQCAIDYARAWDWSVRAPMILKEIGEKLCVA